MVISETVQKLCHKLHNVLQASVNYFNPIAFKVGIYPTVVFKSWNVFEICGSIARGINPNNFLYIKGKYYGVNITLMKECVEGKHGKNE